MADEIILEKKKDAEGIYIRKGITEEINETQLLLELKQINETINRMLQRKKFLEALKAKIDELKKAR